MVEISYESDSNLDSSDVIDDGVEKNGQNSTQSEQIHRSSIIQLDDKTIGLIAAGEVVERPAQVVKELLENSVDAGSTSLTIEIERGGFDLISISDDGHGIPESELQLAVTRHATSKLSDAKDLAAIGTLGFRGEALASIGAVSQLRVASRPAGKEGRSILVSDGEVGNSEPEGMATGTRIEVRNLFANQPARLAFQRRAATETAKVVDVVVSHALCTPNVSYRLTVDGRPILETPKTEDMRDRLYDLLGASSEKMIELSASKTDAEAPGEERWGGWISPPDISRGKSDDVHIIINGRPVASQPFLQSIRRGYHTRLMVGRHPVAVLMLELPADEVDVNVHPTKREVRLRNSWRVLERLERAIKHTLKQVATGEAPTRDFPLGAVDGGKKQAPLPAPSSSEIPTWAKPAKRVESTVQTSFYQGAKTEAKPAEKPRPTSTSPDLQETLPGLEKTPTAPALSSAERELHRHSKAGESVSPLDEPKAENNSEIVTDVPQMEPLAQFADSYILAQGEGCLYVVDQHALHERVRYERLRNSMANWGAQPLIEPIILDFSAVQKAVVQASEGRLEELGFQFQEVDGEQTLTSVPAMLAGDNRLQGFLIDLIAELQESGVAGPLNVAENLADEIAFMKSCRGAVKANQTLSIAEMRRLLKDMETIENPWACVHGRPTVMKLDVNTLDHHFGRHG